MALITPLTTVDGVEVPAAYVRITPASIRVEHGERGPTDDDPDMEPHREFGIRFCIEPYVSKEKQEAGAQPMIWCESYAAIYDLDGPNVYAQAYAFLKAYVFVDAVDA